jgi:metal-responsive CopG/Arc/MetJ family transcriptional regulator
MAKTEVSITIDEELAKEIDDYMRKLVKKAADSGERILKQSNVYEEIVRKGWGGCEERG